MCWAPSGANKPNRPSRTVLTISGGSDTIEMEVDQFDLYLEDLVEAGVGGSAGPRRESRAGERVGPATRTRLTLHSSRQTQPHIR